MEISRRVTLTWIAAASSSLLVTAGCDSQTGSSTGLWKDIALAPLQAPGYGQDPKLTAPAVPWPLTLDKSQRESLRIAADMMLPADAHSPSGATLHLDAFIDEWVSAPYPVQQADRTLIHSGLAWLDAEASSRFGADFRKASDAQRREIFDAVAFRNKVKPGYERPAEFFTRLRGLMLSGFYSLPEGIADIGYMGNKPSVGPYEGPPEAALAFLNASLTKLGIKPV
ncbi:MAG: gluconate 2-dehydrogenase subunit 3 family protein [Rhizomicrobium sp.]